MSDSSLARFPVVSHSYVSTLFKLGLGCLMCIVQLNGILAFATDKGKKPDVVCTINVCRAKASKPSDLKPKGATVKSRIHASPQKSHEDKQANIEKSTSNLAARKDFLKQAKIVQAAVALYKQQLSSRAICLTSSEHPERCGVPQAPDFGTTQMPLEVGGTVPNPDPNAPPRVVVTPEQVAYMAFARLSLKAPKPSIGPAPSGNRWDMAAVGYPLWLWGEGDPHPAPVSDSIGGLFVSLDAHVSKIVFNMGDGSHVTCQGAGRKWSKSVPAGQKSPSCGYIYSQPSLPKGTFTVTATTYWSVDWNVTGITGVIPFLQSASTTVPVGELQVLVR